MGLKGRKKNEIGGELNMIPFVNFMMSVICVLIFSVEFTKIAIIELKLPEGRGSQTASATKTRTDEDESNKLLLTAIITDSVVTLGAKNGFLPSLFYKEVHHYVAKSDQTSFNVDYIPGSKEMPKHPKTGKPMTVHERYDIWLYVVDENTRQIVKAMYSKKGVLVTNANGEILNSLKVGDTVYTVTSPRQLKIVNNPTDYELQYLSAYDELKNRLLKLKERFKDVDDADDIIIAAENEVLYDKIVQLMDVARAADYPNIQIAKLRS